MCRIKESISDKNRNCNNWWIPWVSMGLSIVAIVISIWRMTLSQASIFKDDFEFSYDKLGTIIGIILSAVALVVSLYFIILGIGANSIRRDINNDANDAKQVIKDIAEEADRAVDSIRKDADCIHNEIENESKDNKVIFVTTVYELYFEIIGMTEAFFNKIDIKKEMIPVQELRERIIELKLDQSRFVCNPRNLDIEDRIKEDVIQGINFIKDLSSNKNDLDLIEAVMNKSTNQDIIDAAKNAYDKLK
jgi:uncharacterized membrane protein